MNMQTQKEFDDFQKKLAKSNFKFEQELRQHLWKFENLNILFNNAEKIIIKYFEEQNEFDNIDDFKNYLIEKIRFYVNSFWLSRNEKKSITEELLLISQTYDKIIYFWDEINPEEVRRSKLSEKVQWEIGKKSWEIEKIVK